MTELTYLRWCLTFILVVTAVTDVLGDQDVPELSTSELTFFEAKIRPVLVEHCYECHSEKTGGAEGNLQLDSRTAIRSGGDRGPAVVPGDLEASWLWASVTHADADLRMPPKRERLSNTVLADLKKWIEMGAPDPRLEGSQSDSAEQRAAWQTAGRDFWSYQPPRPTDPPSVADTAWPARVVDQYVLAKLAAQGLAPSPDASPSVLLRRLHFDLVGLPPSPTELEHFLASIEQYGTDAALAQEVDRLIASPQFGQRWGRHWLDVARFGESSGTEANISFPYAWRYRDYVIDCFNQDVPFDRFLIEQIAGDLLESDSDRERARLLIATGYLAVGPKNLDAVDELQFHADLIDEQIDSLTRGVLANSVACARCHDHKFDPFSMEDYYALAGIFASTKTYFGTSVAPANRIGGDPLRLPDLPDQVVLHPSIPLERVEQLKEQLAGLLAEKAEMDAARKAIFSGKEPEKRFTLRETLRVFWQSGGVEGQLEKVSDTGEALPLTMGVLDRPEIIDVPLFERGDLKKPAQIIRRAFPEVLRTDDEESLPLDQSGRLQLARWLTHPDHPLTSRVIVNRVWRHLFGAGIVATVDNFGSTGDLPSHPELLDHLAIEFVRNDWSIKKLVQELVLSRTYRQASTFREDAFQQDPENQLLWRASKRRLEAECIRDAMLAAAGELELARPAGSLVGRVIGDRPISLIGLDKRLPPDLDGCRNRSVYLPVIRDRLPDVLELFDFAEPSLVSGHRETTNVPIQALYLMNSPFVQERAQGLAARLVSAVDGARSSTADESTDRRLVSQAFLLCFSREPEESELERSLEFLASGEDRGAKLIDFCQALLCTGEFRNLD